MANLTAARRKSMPKKEFGMPGSKRFPMPDAAHARLAIGGATRSERAGNISSATEARIKAKARDELGDMDTEKGVSRSKESPHHVKYK